MQALRYWDYYGMTELFTDLYDRAAKQEAFSNLYDVITSRENILLAYRTMKSNKGSKTPGTDGKTITDIQKLSEDELVTEIQTNLQNYRPKKVRRKLIEKDNGKLRPLGIPCILDRIIQQCFKQVLEPIAEAQFYKHSYGFRPLRSTHHAMARVQFLVNQAQLHYVVDIDVLGFFDNVNHTLLVKQLWNMGIQDRRVLACISKMLKAEIDGEGIPTKGRTSRWPVVANYFRMSFLTTGSMGCRSMGILPSESDLTQQDQANSMQRNAPRSKKDISCATQTTSKFSAGTGRPPKNGTMPSGHT